MKELKHMRPSCKKLVRPILRYVMMYFGKQMLSLMQIKNIVSKRHTSKDPVDVPGTQEARSIVICEYIHLCL